jgi:hypothetical protein
MSLGKINLITPPDKLFNLSESFLLVKPSTTVKQQFQAILSQINDSVNVFIFDESDHDIEWMLSVAQQVDHVILDLDNCDPLTRQFATVIMVQANVHYFTTDVATPYNLINRNRIYNLDWMISINEEEEEEDDDE